MMQGVSTLLGIVRVIANKRPDYLKETFPLVSLLLSFSISADADCSTIVVGFDLSMC